MAEGQWTVGRGRNVFDVLIISGDTSQDFLGQDLRDKMRLSVEGEQASLAFLQEYFHADKDTPKAVESLKNSELPFVSLNGPYLQQYLEDQGYSVAHVPLFTPGRPDLLKLLESRPKAVVISTTFLPIAAQIDGIAGFIKKHSPSTQVIAGGIQVWKSHRALRDEIQRMGIRRRPPLPFLNRRNPVNRVLGRIAQPGGD